MRRLSAALARVLQLGERRALASSQVECDAAGDRAAPGRSQPLGGVAQEDLPDDARVVFISYAREDEQWRRRFETMLRPLGPRGLVVWSDERIAVGEPWRAQLDAAIARADAALVLVSPDLLNSSFIMREELPALIERGIPLAFVHVRDSLVDQVDVLADVQWAHDRGAPIAGARDPDREIRQACEQLVTILPAAEHEAAAPPAERVLAPTRQRLRAVRRGGALHDVPRLPQGYVQRDELARVREALASSSAGAVGITGRAVGLHGQGGIGKSVLAAAVAHDELVRMLFPDGIWWVTVGERADLVAVQLALLERVGAARPHLRSIDACMRQLCETFAERRCLIVADDVWSAAAARAFDVTGPEGRVLYTTRDRGVLETVHAVVQPVGVLADEQARRLLGVLAGIGDGPLPRAAERVLEATGRVALAVALVGAAIRGGRSWEKAEEDLQRGDHTFGGHPYADVFKAMQAATDALRPELREIYRTLAAFPEDTRVPITTVTRLWKHLAVIETPGESRRLLDELADRELVTLDQETFGFHDLQREFLLLRAGDVRLLHADLLAAYRPGDGRWHTMELDEPYIWEHLLEHLRAAGDTPGMRGASTNLGYLAIRCYRDGPYAAESDVRAAAAVLAPDPALKWAAQLLTRSGQVLSAHGTLGEVVAAIAFRAHDAPPPLGLDPLRALASGRLLTARWGLSQPAQELRRVLAGHTAGVLAVAFSPDGRQLVSAGNDGAVRLWDSATGAPRARLDGHPSGVWAVAFSPDGRTLASAGNDRTVRLWDAGTGAQRSALDGHTDWVRAVAFSPNGRVLASAGNDGLVRLCDVRTGAARAELEGHTGGIWAVAFSPDGRTLASAGNDRTVRLWDAATGVRRAQLDGHNRGVLAIAFTPDGRYLASASDDHTVRLWDVSSALELAQLRGHSSSVRAVAFSPDGATLASAGSDVRIWDAAAGTQRAELQGHTSAVRAVAFSGDGRTLASASNDHTVRLWNVPAPAPLAQSDRRNSNVRVIVHKARGQRSARARDDDTAWRWVAATVSERAQLDAHSSGVRTVAFSPDGRTLASAGDDRRISLWDAANGDLLAEFHGETRGVRAVAISPDGRTLASAGDDHAVRLWTIAVISQRAQLDGHASWVLAVAFSPDGRTLASAGSDRTVRLWDAATGAQRAQLDGHASWVLAVAFSPDGRTLASAGSDRTVRLWDAATGAQRALLEGHEDWVRALAYSPDSRTLASAGDDRTVRLWNQRGERSNTPFVHPAPVHGLAFTPDADSFITADKDGDLRVWDTGSDEPTYHVDAGVRVNTLAANGNQVALATATGVIVADGVALATQGSNNAP